jgi:hypothetical protein
LTGTVFVNALAFLFHASTHRRAKVNRFTDKSRVRARSPLRP